MAGEAPIGSPPRDIFAISSIHVLTAHRTVLDGGTGFLKVGYAGQVYHEPQALFNSLQKHSQPLSY